MDRWGPSEDCKICGHPQSYGHFAVCPACGRTMCDWCVGNEHECYDVYSDERGDLE